MPMSSWQPSRRAILRGTLALPALLGVGAATAHGSALDWSKAVVDSTMRRETPDTIGGWDYPVGLYLYSQYLVYRRSGEAKYFDYVKAWMDRFVDKDGGIQVDFKSLDSMRSGQLLPLLYEETKDERYRRAADRLREAIAGYPRTSDGAFIHRVDYKGQLWADGVFMALPFLALYGRIADDGGSYDEAVKNMTLYFDHLKTDNGLMLHAYDEDGSEPWAVGDLHSDYHWARAIGWVGMAAIDILDVLPTEHPGRQSLIDIVRHLATGYARFQDRDTGRWFQVVDRGDDSRNWTETSASSMYTFMLSRGVESGYLDDGYRAAAEKGYKGVLDKASVGGDGLTKISDISEGTNVGDLEFYLGRARKTNDLHGVGAFVIMNEQLTGKRSMLPSSFR